MEVLDVLDQCTRPSLDRFRDTRRKMKELPYVELQENSIIEVFDEDEGDIKIMVELGVAEKSKGPKEEALSVAELNAKLEQKMKEDMASAAAENARKISVIQRQDGAHPRDAEQDAGPRPSPTGLPIPPGLPFAVPTAWALTSRALLPTNATPNAGGESTPSGADEQHAIPRCHCSCHPRGPWFMNAPS